MPIQVFLEVQGEPQRVLHIGRVKGAAKPDSINIYSAVLLQQPVKKHRTGFYSHYPSNQEWDGGVKFEHRYGDGIEVCVLKALEALNTNGGFQ